MKKFFGLIFFSLLVLQIQATLRPFAFIISLKLLIDCGLAGDTTEEYNGWRWFPYSFFTSDGKTKRVSANMDNNIPGSMTNLRYFPDGESCYKLALNKTTKYIFRAGFYYGNYDGQMQPPVFDLLLGGNLWATVDTSVSDEPIFHEVMYQPKNDNISVCLAGKDGGGTPFISSLEATFLDDNERANVTQYHLTKEGTAFHLVSRLNFGGYDGIIEPWSSVKNTCEEHMNRYWTPREVPGYLNYTINNRDSCFGTLYENQPPVSVIKTCIGPENASESIHLDVDLPNNSPQSTYFVFYFFHNISQESTTKRRSMEIHIDGVLKSRVEIKDSRLGEVVSLYPVLVLGTTNVTISPANGTDLPPIINAMEVFIAKELMEHAIPSEGFQLSSSLIHVLRFHVFLTLIFVFI